MSFKIKKNVLVKYKGVDTKIAIPYGVTSIGMSAFWGCSSLESIEIPYSTTFIDAWAFRGCTSLTNVTLPNSMKVIGVFAFEGCISLTNITIPDSVTVISDDAFYGCIGLTIKCNPGSYAESWAKKYGIKTEPIMSQMRLLIRETKVDSFTPECECIER